MLALPLGPFALPVGPLLVFGALAVAMALAGRIGLQTPNARGLRPPDILQHAAVAGLVAARLGQVVQHIGAYAEAPASAFDPRDGAWHAPSGVAVALAWVAVAAWRWPAFRRSLGIAAAVGGIGWGAVGAGLRASAEGPLPSTRLVSLNDGTPVDLTTLADGRPMLLNLWATWCGPCRAEMPALAEAQRRRPDVVFVFANQGERPEAVRGYLARAGLDLDNVVLDLQGGLSPEVGSGGLPTSVFFDEYGRRFDAHMGALNGPAIDARFGPATAP
ncbi:MAG: hypothetical protein RLZZ383_1706 [Pseudomonadota bacterium]|jgi:thiol-disulfide isomerase/thioredoxin